MKESHDLKFADRNSGRRPNRDLLLRTMRIRRRISMRNQIVTVFSFLLVVLFLVGCKKNDPITPDITSSGYRLDDSVSTSISVCVYLDEGVFDVCKTNTVYMLNEMRCHYSVITRDSILNGALSHYRLLLMPGGDMWKYRSYLATAGMAKITEYVGQGGGYIGICGGAYFAAYQIVWRGWANQPRDSISIYGLNLVSAIADGPIEDFAPSYVSSKCQIRIIQPENPLAAGLPDVIEPYYDHGPKFLFSDDINISTLGRTVIGDKKIILSFQYGLGKVFLTGAHPESVDSRVSWKMVKNAMKWCSR
jgi:glutamine amidotransferase-like uncharacterized protein